MINNINISSGGGINKLSSAAVAAFIIFSRGRIDQGQ